MQSASCSSRMHSVHIVASHPRIQLRSCIWWKASSPAPRWRRRALGTALGSVDLRLAIVHIIIALACARMCVCVCDLKALHTQAPHQALLSQTSHVRLRVHPHLAVVRVACHLQHSIPMADCWQAGMISTRSWQVLELTRRVLVLSCSSIMVV